MNYFKRLHALFESLLPGEKITFAFQNAPREKAPSWMIQLVSNVNIGSPSRSQGVDDNGDRLTRVVKDFNFRIQYFGKDAFWKVEELRQEFSKETVLESFYKQGFSVYNLGATFNFYNDTDYGQLEAYAGFDVFCYYSYAIKDNVGIIDTVIIDTDYNPKDDEKEYTIAKVIVNDKFGD